MAGERRTKENIRVGNLTDLTNDPLGNIRAGVAQEERSIDATSTSLSDRRLLRCHADSATIRTV